MDDHIKIDVSPFDMLPRTLTSEYGLVCSGVYARVRGFANQRGVCSASHERIAKDLGLTRPTVHKWIKVLVADGYLDDITPDIKNRPHKYEVTKKLEYAGSLTVKQVDTTVKIDDTPTVKEFDSSVKPLYSKRKSKIQEEETIEDKVPLAHRQKLDLQLALEGYFASSTSLELPPRETASQKKAGATRWWRPLWEMLELVEWNIDDAKLAIDEIKKAYDSDQLDYDSPASFLRKYRSIVAKARRGIMPHSAPKAVHAVQQAIANEVQNG